MEHGTQRSFFVASRVHLLKHWERKWSLGKCSESNYQLHVQQIMSNTLPIAYTSHSLSLRPLVVTFISSTTILSRTYVNSVLRVIPFTCY